MTTEDDFRRALGENPADVHTRLVYADWLDDADRPLDAATNRVLAEPDDDAHRLNFADCCDRLGDRDRAEFVRVQVELARMSPGPLACPQCGSRLARQPMSSYPDLTRCTTCRFAHGPFWEDTKRNVGRYESLERRQQQLLADPRNYVNWTPSVMHTGSRAGIRYETGGTVGLFGTGWGSAEFRRGFVEKLTCGAENFLGHADAIRAAHPVREVTLTTLPEMDLRRETDTLLGTARLVARGRAIALPEGYDIGASAVHRTAAAVVLLNAEFPGVRFVPPPPSDVPTGVYGAVDYTTWTSAANTVFTPEQAAAFLALSGPGPK